MTVDKSGPSSATEPTGHSDLGRRIAERRAALGLSREEVAERSGAATTYIAYLEERAAAPGRGVLIRLADALRTSVDELSGTTVDLPPGRASAARDAALVSLDEDECRRLLSTHGVGRVATYGTNGPAVLPVNYVLAGAGVAFRTSEQGALAEASGTEVAFEVDHIDDAMRRGWSVLAVGQLERVTDDAAVRRLEDTARSLPWAGGDRPLWMTVAPQRLTGRRIDHE
ncbi:helix-turn-helix domain-containing protein [Streptomyces sp. NBC_01431]|uniref:helix-turn-helix domain-containing protein n=1 Tax=Streptomyces sp. NBC_01431 TaxID=2903863 RepID=UPI002E346FB4|nr:pyridoxamine 5'-phosphate oxidase family protein [Streptomyces sp. NBC_01431]